MCVYIYIYIMYICRVGQQYLISTTYMSELYLKQRKLLETGMGK